MNQPVTPTGEVHPAADVFPMIEGDELEALVQSIRDYGLTEPIWLTRDGVLLDGRNRLAACKKAGVAPSFRVYEGDDLVEFIVRLNVDRRHLTAGQRALAALELLPFYEAQVKRGRPAAKQVIPADLQELPAADRESTSRVAKAVNAKGRTVAQAKRVKTHAPDLAEKVREGSLSLDAAERQLKRRKAKQEEQAARDISLATLPADAEGLGWRLLAGDFRDRLNELPDGSVDLIVTDPPYPREFIDLWSDLSKHAARVLKPQGLLVAMSGLVMVNEVMERLGEHLEYGWIYVQNMSNQTTKILGRKIYTQWKPWLVYTNGKWPSGSLGWHGDQIDAGGRSKGTYRWEQDPTEAQRIIEALSREGDVILDPFTGTGAYGHATIAAGRQFIGVEKDRSRFDIASFRLEQPENH